MSKGLQKALQLESGSVVAVIGCGGKTTFIQWLAGELAAAKVLLSTTTKIYPPSCSAVVVCKTLEECKGHIPTAGVQCLGVLNSKTNKLESMPETMLGNSVKRYNFTLLEADGSKGLPCKGWRLYEPQVPAYTTHTVGIFPVNALGLAANAANVHRLPEFLKLTGLQENQIITEDAIIAMVGAPQGMFAKSAGKRCLFINQVSTAKEQAQACKLLEKIEERLPNKFTVLLYGSAQNKTFTIKNGG